MKQLVPLTRPKVWDKVFIVELIHTINDLWYFRIKNRNGRILCHSEQYVSQQGAMRTARKIKSALKAAYRIIHE